MAGDRQFYLKRSYEKAFGQFDEANWNPQLGFAANEARILKLYDYYRDTYLARPDIFLWAGLGRMAGGAVVGGLRLFVAIGSETFFTQTMVRVGKEIFHDLAWQHEAILDDETNALKLAAEHDAASPARRSYRQAWEHILSGDEARVATGNKMLLENEQFTIIQPSYNQVAGSTEGGFGGPMRSLKAFTNSIHPYHRDFLLSLPTGDIVKAADRWSWITETGGMWEKWGEKRGVPAAPIAMSRTERARLVSLPMDKIIKREFAPVDQTLMPPGAFDI
jgi:hypothetical protein